MKSPLQQFLNVFYVGALSGFEPINLLTMAQPAIRPSQQEATRQPSS